MRRGVSSIVGLTLLVGCSSASPSPPIANDATLPVLERSGSRLQARGFEVDGLFVFDGFFDTQLGVACDRGQASDGSDRCVPRVDACAAPVTAEPGALVAFTSTSEVPLAEGFAAVVANGEDGSRVGTGELSEGGKRCALAPAVCGAAPASTCTTPLGDGSTTRGALQEKTKTTSDGTPVSRAAIVDPSLGGSCRFQKTIDGSIRCAPVDVATVVDNAFSDPACTRPVFQRSACDAKYVRYDEPQPCGTLPRFFLIEPLGDQMYTRTDEGCVLGTPRPGLVAYGSELRPEQLAFGQPATR